MKPLSKYAQQSREERLANLYQRIQRHPGITAQIRHGTVPVMGRGSVNPRILLLGDCPDAEDEVRGSVLAGPKAHVVNGIIRTIGAEEVYYANVLFWRPVGRDNLDDRKPNKSELKVCLPFINQLIDILEPQVIVTLGTTPFRSLGGPAKPLSQCIGQFFRYRGYPLFPVYDPEYLERSQTKGTPVSKRDYWVYFLRIMRFVGIQPSETQANAFLGRGDLFNTILWAKGYVPDMARAATAAAQREGRTLKDEEAHVFERFAGRALEKALAQLEGERRLVELLNRSVYTVAWPKRILTVFRRSGIETYKDLVTRPMRQLRGIGPVYQSYIQNHLKEVDLPLNAYDTLIFSKDAVY